VEIPVVGTSYTECVCGGCVLILLYDTQPLLYSADVNAGWVGWVFGLDLSRGQSKKKERQENRGMLTCDETAI